MIESIIQHRDGHLIVMTLNGGKHEINETRVKEFCRTIGISLSY